MEDFYRKWFDKSLQNGVDTVTNKWLGNYTTAYNTWKRMESINNLFQKNVNNRGGNLYILDVGCGDALPLFILNTLNDNTRRLKFYGIDISVLNITFAENLKTILKTDNILFSIGNAEKLPFQDSYFDIVICGEVIEHLKQPENCLKEIKRVLKNGGVSLISTPNGNNPVQCLLRMFKKGSATNSLKLLKSHSPEHINVRNIKTWKQIFLSTGFSIIVIRRHGILYGGYKYNRHRLLFAILVVLDLMLDILSFGQNISEGITFEITKSK